MWNLTKTCVKTALNCKSKHNPKKKALILAPVNPILMKILSFDRLQIKTYFFSRLLWYEVTVCSRNRCLNLIFILEKKLNMQSIDV